MSSNISPTAVRARPVASTKRLSHRDYLLDRAAASSWLESQQGFIGAQLAAAGTRCTSHGPTAWSCAQQLKLCTLHDRLRAPLKCRLMRRTAALVRGTPSRAATLHTIPRSPCRNTCFSFLRFSFLFSGFCRALISEPLRFIKRALDIVGKPITASHMTKSSLNESKHFGNEKQEKKTEASQKTEASIST